MKHKTAELTDWMHATPEPISSVLWNLARDYYRRTEAYDRTVCTGPILRDGIMPNSPREFGLVNRNAKAVYMEILGQAENAGYTIEQLRHAMRVCGTGKLGDEVEL